MANIRPVPEPPSVPGEEGVELIRKQVELAEELIAKKPLAADKYNSWKNTTQACLEKAFGLHSPHIGNFLLAGRHDTVLMDPT